MNSRILSPVLLIRHDEESTPYGCCKKTPTVREENPSDNFGLSPPPWHRIRRIISSNDGSFEDNEVATARVHESAARYAYQLSVRD